VPSLSLKRRKQSTKAKISLREIARRKQKKRNTTPRMRSVAAEIVTVQLKVDTFITVCGSLTRFKNLRFCG